MTLLLLLAAGLLTLICAGMLLYQLFRFTPEESLAAAILLLMLLVFVTGLAGNTAIAFICMLAMALCGLVFFLANLQPKGGRLRRCPQNGKTFAAFFSPGLALWGMALAAGWALFGRGCLNNWDELAHWGKAVRFMLRYDQLPQGALFDGFSYMQSTTTYFHYFMGRFTGLREGGMYVSNLLLWSAAAILPLSGTGWKQAKGVFLYGLTLFISMYALYPMPYYNLYCEQAAALWTAGLVAWQLRADIDSKRWGLTLGAVVCIALMKPQVGPLLAVMAMVCIGVTALIHRRLAVKRPVPSPRERAKRLLFCLLMAALPFALVIVWGLFSDTAWFTESGSTFLAQFSNRAKLSAAVTACLNKLFLPVAGHKSISFFTWFVFCCLGSFLGRQYLSEGPYKKKYSTITALYLAGFPLFFGLLAIAYLALLPESDLANATSIERYFSIYMMIAIPVIALPFYLEPQAVSAPSAKRPLAIGAMALLLVGMSVNLDRQFLYDVTNLERWGDPYYKTVMEVRAQSQRIGELVPEEEKVYFIAQDSYNITSVAAEYGLGLRYSRAFGGYQFASEEAGSQAMTGLYSYDIEELPARLDSQGIGYVWVEASNEHLAKAFERLFGVSPVSGGLYRYENGALSLVEDVSKTRPDPKALE